MALLAGAGAGALAQRVTRAKMRDLHGQVALVTGGGRGFGLLLARELGLYGCRVAICGRDEMELARGQAQLEAAGIQVLSLPCDITDPAAVERMVATTIARYGQIDILINNAGIIQAKPLDATNLADFEASMDTMFWGLYTVTMAVLPAMQERGGGRIGNITSVGGKISIPHLLPYCAAKFAATGFSEGLRAELAGSGVTVTTIIPGLLRTGSFTNAFVGGQPELEYPIFALASSAPLLSMDARRAAKQAIQAVRRGQAERILGVPAFLLAKAHGVSPNATAPLLSLAVRLLPGARQGDRASTQGRDVPAPVNRGPLRILTALGWSAARRNNELPKPEIPASRTHQPGERSSS